MTCANCKYFSIHENPEKGAAGFGKCSGFVSGLATFVEWNDKACRLFRPAKQQAPREEYIAQQQARTS